MPGFVSSYALQYDVEHIAHIWTESVHCLALWISLSSLFGLGPTQTHPPELATHSTYGLRLANYFELIVAGDNVIHYVNITKILQAAYISL